MQSKQTSSGKSERRFRPLSRDEWRRQNLLLKSLAEQNQLRPLKPREPTMRRIGRAIANALITGASWLLALVGIGIYGIVGIGSCVVQIAISILGLLILWEILKRIF